MTVKRTKPVSLEELWDFEDRNPAVFAGPRAVPGTNPSARVKVGRRPQAKGTNGTARIHAKRRNGLLN